MMGALVAVCAASCGGPPAPADLVGTTTSDIQGGATDTTHLFAVGVVQLADQGQGMVAFCTGVLLAPNLVATARHCVAQLTTTDITCSTSKFGPLFPVTDVFVTTDTNITMNSLFHPVSTLVVPTGSDQTFVCGNDIALMILGDNIDLPQYVEPVITPPMTSPQYEPVVTAIGYGITSPTDTMGMTAGTRRIKENVALTCIPNDTMFTDCFTDPDAKMLLTSGEFVSGDSTCEGDSGSAAFEQSNFDEGNWVAFGVLSRGSQSADNTTCEQPIYTRFDAWGSLIVDAAQQAAKAATAQGVGYALPAWAGGAATVAGGGGPGSVYPDAGDCTSGDCVSSGAKAAGSSSGGCDVAGHEGPAAPGSGRSLALLGLAWAVAVGRRRRAGPRPS